MGPILALRVNGCIHGTATLAVAGNDLMLNDMALISCLRPSAAS
jgi:hypothetical protein